MLRRLGGAGSGELPHGSRSRRPACCRAAPRQLQPRPRCRKVRPLQTSFRATGDKRRKRNAATESGYTEASRTARRIPRQRLGKVAETEAAPNVSNTQQLSGS